MPPLGAPWTEPPATAALEPLEPLDPLEPLEPLDPALEPFAQEANLAAEGGAAAPTPLPRPPPDAPGAGAGAGAGAPPVAPLDLSRLRRVPAPQLPHGAPQRPRTSNGSKGGGTWWGAGLAAAPAPEGRPETAAAAVGAGLSAREWLMAPRAEAREEAGGWGALVTRPPVVRGGADSPPPLVLTGHAASLTPY